MAYAVEHNCPLTFQNWSGRTSSTCSNQISYHYLEDEISMIVEVCTVPLWIQAGILPYNCYLIHIFKKQICSFNVKNTFNDPLNDSCIL